MFGKASPQITFQAFIQLSQMPPKKEPKIKTPDSGQCQGPIKTGSALLIVDLCKG